jgi:hypothetical protein
MRFYANICHQTNPNEIAHGEKIGKILGVSMMIKISL